MKRLLVLVVASLFATVLVSCEKSMDESNVDLQPAPNGVEQVAPRTFTFQIAGSESKVDINSSTGKTTWKPGDQILIHGEYMGIKDEKVYSTVVTLSDEDIDDTDPSIATFTLTDDVVPYIRYHTTLYAAYPASAVMNYNNGDQWFYWNRFKNTNVPLMTGFNDDRVNNGNTFKFYNLCSVISFVVSGDFDAYSFSGKHSEIVGYDGYQCRVHVYDDTSEKNVWNDESNSYPMGPKTSLEVTDWTGADGSTVNYICIPNGVTFSEGFIINFMKNGVITKRVTSSKSLTLARNDLLPLGNISGKLKDYVDPRKTITIPASAYPSSPDATGYKMTIDGVDFYAVNARKKSSGTDVVLVNGVNVAIYNGTELGKIATIVINKGPGTTMYNSFTVYGGSSSNPTTNVISGSTVSNSGGGYSSITYDFSSANYKYFSINYSSEYEGYCGDIEITYLDE